MFKLFQIGVWLKDTIDKIARLHCSGKNSKGSKGIRIDIKVFNNKLTLTLLITHEKKNSIEQIPTNLTLAEARLTI